ncbi:hypothetical protein, partial [Escherichia coli]|uniref:hypothetical protein n=3 Tax=Pseudomonadota TaxID=1224 RepID=UPI001BFE225C
ARTIEETGMDRAMIEERLEQFRLQHAAGEERLKALDAQIAEVKRTQLRILGAIGVLEEMLQEQAQG